MTISELLADIALKYAEYKTKVEVDSTASVYGLVTKKLPEKLHNIVGDKRPYKIEGSTGRGIITPAPWISIFDTAITRTAQKGYYVVYLYALNLKTIYLSLALGVTEFEKTFGNNKIMLKQLDKATGYLASRLDIPNTYITGPIDLSSVDPLSLHGRYEHANIMAISYDINKLPPDHKIVNDVQTFLNFYEQLRQDVGASIDEEIAVEDIKTRSHKQIEVIPFVKYKEKLPKKKTSTYQPVRRSKESKKVGDAGEHLVFKYEKKRLKNAGHNELATNVRWLADEGKYPGYDILSFNEDGSERWIEVKATKGARISTVELTENERSTALKAPSGRYWLYLVIKVFTRPKLMIVQDPVEALSWNEDNPVPTSWRLELS